MRTVTDETPPPDTEHPPRVIVLSDAQIDAIAERVEERMLIRIGKRVVDKVLWALGVCVVAVAVWLSAKGVK
jgi:hypothetical protein